MYGIHSRTFTVGRDVVFKEDVFPFKYAHTTFSIFPILNLTFAILSYPKNKSLFQQPQHISSTNSSLGAEIPLSNTASETAADTSENSVVGDLDVLVSIPAEPSLPFSSPLAATEPLLLGSPAEIADLLFG